VIYKKYYCDGSRNNILEYKNGCFRLFVPKIERPHHFICSSEYYVIDGNVILAPLYRDVRIKKCFVIRGDVDPNAFIKIKVVESSINENIEIMYSKKQLEFEREKIDVITGAMSIIKTVVDAMGNVN
jgi:hypothetical protein